MQAAEEYLAQDPVFAEFKGKYDKSRRSVTRTGTETAYASVTCVSGTHSIYDRVALFGLHAVFDCPPCHSYIVPCLIPSDGVHQSMLHVSYPDDANCSIIIDLPAHANPLDHVY